MKKKIWWIAGAVGVVLLFVGAFFLYDSLREDYAPAALPAGKKAKIRSRNSRRGSDFTAVDGEGNEVSLSDYFGKPVVLNFWASWCPPCKAEMPHFESAYQENADIQFLMVNMTTSSRESLTAAKEFIQAEGYTFPVLFDTEGNAAPPHTARPLCP